MRPRITLLTRGVDDLERSVKFYRDALGLPTQGIVGTEFEHGAVAFFDLESGLKLAVWKRADLAFDVGIPVTAPSVTEFSIGHNVRSRQEVDQVMQQAEAAGARIVKQARDTFWGGYAGYFQDPDNHLWEIAWNPALLPGGLSGSINRYNAITHAGVCLCAASRTSEAISLATLRHS